MPEQRDSTDLAQLKVRLRESLRARLEQAAKARGLSLNAETVDRLERSFERGDLLGEVMSAIYGRELAGALIAAGTAMQYAGLFGMTQGQKWFTDQFAFDQAVIAANRVFDALRPEKPVEPRGKDYERGNAYSDLVLFAVMRHRGGQMFDAEGELIRSLLGPEIVKRIRTEGQKR